jgi:hypothetical protein
MPNSTNPPKVLVASQFRPSSIEIRAILIPDFNYKTPDALRIYRALCTDDGHSRSYVGTGGTRAGARRLRVIGRSIGFSSGE